MEKKVDKKKQTILASVIVVALIAIVAAFFLKGEKGYRSIQVYQVNGLATIERENVGSMDAYENLNLLSGDLINVLKESFLRLKLDHNKYLLAEEESVMRIYALGDEKNSKTDIQLEKGAITIEVDEKLQGDASFEVTTPNSVMAVRGTVFRVSTDVDENGKPITKVSILEGAVAIQTIDENGNVTEETLVSDGQEALIYSDNGEEVLVLLDEIDFTSIPVETLEFLKEVSEERRELSISAEEIEQIIEGKRKETQETDTQEGETQQEENSQQEESEASEEDRESSERNEQTSNEESQSPTEESQPPTENLQPSVDVPVTYTVTFIYNGEVFGTQIVTSGELAEKPSLMPAPSGSWDFDFNTPITENMEIEFVE